MKRTIDNFEKKNPEIRCAIYARCASASPPSTSNSTADQIRTCTKYAKRQGWKILKELVVTDVTISGASLVKRHALRSLMAAAEKKPRPFDRVLVADMSRLARNVEVLLQIVNHFYKNGVDVITIREGFVWPKHRTAFLLWGPMDEQYLPELSKKLAPKGQENDEQSR